jgi:hypothetical protein
MGFTFGLGQWKLSGKDKKQLEAATQTNIKDEQRIAYLGMRGYDANLFGNTQDWTVDFNAQMPTFAARPTTSDFT